MDYCVQPGVDQTNANGWASCCGNADTDQGISEIVVKLEDDDPFSTETVSLPDEDLYLFASVSDFEYENLDSDSSYVPPGKQDANVGFPVERIKSGETGSVGKDTIPKTGRKRKPGRKKQQRNQRNPSSSNSEPKLRRKKNLLPKISNNLGQPQMDGKGESKVSVEPTGMVCAPYTQAETTFSPQVAIEPPGSPSLQDKMNGAQHHCPHQCMTQVLPYIQSLSTAMQRLEQKIDSLQADCNRLYQHIQNSSPSVQHGTLWKEEQQPLLWRQIKNSPRQNVVYPVTCSQANFPDSRETHVGNPYTTAAPKPNTNCGEAEKTNSTKTTGRGKGRAVAREAPSKGVKTETQRKRRRKVKSTEDSDGHPTSAKVSPRKRASPGGAGKCRDGESPCTSKLAKILSELQERRTTTASRSPVEESRSATRDVNATSSQDKQVMIGSAFRKVYVPYSVYMEAFRQEEPQKAVVPVLHSVFPHAVLSSSAVIGDPHRGIQELSPNKLEAIREWLAEMYPRHELDVKGKAWADCLGVLNGITRKLKMEMASVPSGL